MMNLQLRVNHQSCRLGNSSGLFCFWFKSVVCVQIFDKQAGLTLCRQLRAQLTPSRQLCRSLFFSHKKKPLPAITARAKGNFKYFSIDFLFWTSHTLSPDCFQTCQDKNCYYNSYMQQAPTQTENYSCNKSEHQTCTARFYLHPKITLHFPTCCH